MGKQCVAPSGCPCQRGDVPLIVRHGLSHRPRIFLLLLSLGIASCSSSSDSSQKPPATQADQNFEENVRPLFEHRCIWCHNREAPLAGLDFQNPKSLFDKKTQFVVPGHPQRSRIYQAITRSFKHPMVMPGDGWGIADSYREGVKRWIEEGAHWPEGPGQAIRRLPYQVELDDL